MRGMRASAGGPLSHHGVQVVIVTILLPCCWYTGLMLPAGWCWGHGGRGFGPTRLPPACTSDVTQPWPWALAWTS